MTISRVGLKSVALAALGVAAIASGAVAQLIYPGWDYPPSLLWFSLLTAFLIFAWYRLDTDQVGYQRSVWLNIAVIFLTPIALSYYFFRSRSFRAGAVATLLMLAAMALWFALEYSASMLVSFAVQG